MIKPERNADNLFVLELRFGEDDLYSSLKLMVEILFSMHP